MNAKAARKIRKHVQATVHPKEWLAAEKHLKKLWEQGLIKFNKQ